MRVAESPHRNLMKTTMIPLVVAGLFGQVAFAGPAPVTTSPIAPSTSPDAFADVRRPITNPTLFDLALPTTNIHPIFLHHRLPKNIDLAGGGQLPVGGDVQLYALQFEIALNERLSIVATKDGYVDFNPDNNLSSTDGFANLGGGLKYAFLHDPASRTIVSGTATVEFPTGNSDVLQGEGKGLANLILNGLKMHDAWQFAGSVGMQIPFSDEQSTSSFVSAHASYELSSWFIPLVEVNWFHVWDAGDGTNNFNGQLGGAVPGAIAFEGGDLFNVGAVNAGQNRDLVTAAIGFRSRLNDSVQVGVAYEIPLTDDSASVMRDRLTLDLVWRF
jgi:hypothetical protein